jgi:hypothetical protein
MRTFFSLRRSRRAEIKNRKMKKNISDLRNAVPKLQAISNLCYIVHGILRMLSLSCIGSK